MKNYLTKKIKSLSIVQECRVRAKSKVRIHSKPTARKTSTSGGALLYSSLKKFFTFDISFRSSNAPFEIPSRSKRVIYANSWAATDAAI